MADSIDLQDVYSKQVRPFRFAVGFYNKGGDGDEGPVIIRFRMLYRYQYRQQQKSISDFDISIQVQQQQQQQRPKRVFLLYKRKKTGPLCWHQHHGRNGSGLPATATTKKTNRNNNNNDDDCNTNDSINLQDEKHKGIKNSMRFKTRTDKEKSNRLPTGSLTTRTTTTMMMIVIRPIRSTHSTYRLHVQIIMVKFTRQLVHKVDFHFNFDLDYSLVEC